MWGLLGARSKCVGRQPARGTHRRDPHEIRTQVGTSNPADIVGIHSIDRRNRFFRHDHSILEDFLRSEPAGNRIRVFQREPEAAAKELLCLLELSVEYPPPFQAIELGKAAFQCFSSLLGLCTK